jgi:hypothetical protein
MLKEKMGKKARQELAQVHIPFQKRRTIILIIANGCLNMRAKVSEP